MKITEEILRQFLTSAGERRAKRSGMDSSDRMEFMYHRTQFDSVYEQGFMDGARGLKEYIEHLQKDEEECESSL